MDAETQRAVSGSGSGPQEAEIGDEFAERYLSSYRDIVRIGLEDIMKMEWHNIDAAYEFYRLYGKCNGFGVRKGDSRKDTNGELVSYRFFCNRQGVRESKYHGWVDRKRAPRAETRTNCEAKLSIFLDKGDNMWKVRKVVLQHNHELTPLRMVHMIPIPQEIPDAAKSCTEGMHGQGVATSRIVGYMAGMAGGYRMLDFLKKDAYNFVDKKCRERIVDGDANATIVYLEGKAGADPMVSARYLQTESGMLGNLFWADGASRVDYQHFGDVIALDSTYRKNKYRRPLVIFSGVNNHKQTCVFGFGLLVDETAASYKWLLEQFLEVMCGKRPCVLVTYGDKAIGEAIKAIMPEVTHRLCAWHIEKNVTSNMKDIAVRDLFKRWLYADMGVNKFEEEWAEAMKEYGLGDSFWATQMYEKRKMWSNAYLRDKFCVGFRTTSRFEGINSIVKYMSALSRYTLVELVQGLDLLVQEYRNTELLAQFNSIYDVPVMTTCFRSIEMGAALTYTREIFQEVRKQIELMGAVNLIAKTTVSTVMTYTMEEYGNPGVNIQAMYETSIGRVDCECNFWKRHGFPCCHMFFVMKYEHLKEIPEGLILRRWRKNAKAMGEYMDTGEECSERGFLLRHGALHSASQWMFMLGAQRYALCKRSMDVINGLCKELEEELRRTKEGAKSTGTRPDLEDPEVVSTKGAPRQGKKMSKKRKCKRCNQSGRNKQQCPEPRTPWEREINAERVGRGQDVRADGNLGAKVREHHIQDMHGGAMNNSVHESLEPVE
ncbi:hypothetical protein PIB30_118282 [Stylosanthes scabra]|nr:hypothetical protein [Stylosanthes scabra]